MKSVHTWLLVATVAGLTAAQNPPLKAMSPVRDIRIECGSSDIVVSIFTKSIFNGMVYPKGLSKNSSCMAEFASQEPPVKYRLSLRSCNTMGVQQDEGIEYFNTIVVQPHRRLVTNQGRGYHIRCKYRTRDKAADSDSSVSQLDATALSAAGPSAPMPVCSMKIYSDVADKTIAETVNIGDPLTLEVSIDEQEVYGMRIIDCVVRDGMGWGQQQLINTDGCPVDYEILGPMKYSDAKTSGSVRFEAHKFPYTDSVYYQCRVRLCLKYTGGCDTVPPVCKGGKNVRRRRALQNATVSDYDPEDERVIEVFSGLYVNEGSEVDEPTEDGPTRAELDDDDILCISPRTFAIAIAIIGLLLMIAVIVAIMVIISRRRRRKTVSATGSSIYSGPYTNTAYSHSS